MEEKKLTDEEIVKELINESNRGEWCDLNFIDCVEVRILKDALDLINRQKAEIERMTKDKSFATRKMMESKAKAVELQKKVDELTEERDKAKRDNTSLLYNVSRVEKENAELQKQLDELKSALADTIKRNEELIEENEQAVKSSDFAMRMKDERDELLDRITKLGNVINSPERIKELGLSDEDVNEMNVQYYAMQIYEKALTSRFNRVTDKSNPGNLEFAKIDALFKDMATRYKFSLGTDWVEKSWTVYNQTELRLKRENLFVEIMSFANNYNLQGVINFEPQDTICFKYIGDKDGK